MLVQRIVAVGFALLWLRNVYSQRDLSQVWENRASFSLLGIMFAFDAADAAWGG